MKYVSAVIIGVLAALVTAATDNVVYGGLTALAGILAIEGISFLRLKTEVTSTPVKSETHDVDAFNAGLCPTCGESGSLLNGPSGGMSMNVACESCLMEFNVHSGFGTGVFSVDYNGKMDLGRAAAFGITAEEFIANPNSGVKLEEEELLDLPAQPNLGEEGKAYKGPHYFGERGEK